MSKQKHDPHAKAQHGNVHHQVKKSKLIHHDWRFWTAIVLMLLAISAYVLTLDEAVRPGGVEQPEVPAMAE